MNDSDVAHPTRSAARTCPKASFRTGSATKPRTPQSEIIQKKKHKKHCPVKLKQTYSILSVTVDHIKLLYNLSDGVVTDAVLLDDEHAVVQVLPRRAGVAVRDSLLNVRRRLTTHHDAGTGMNGLHRAAATVEVGTEGAYVVIDIGPVQVVVLPEEEEAAALPNLQCSRVYGAEELRVADISA